jgi:hypothetical protein
VARDITEGRATRAIAVDLSMGTENVWRNTGVQYDFAIGGIPFLAAINDQRPYERATAQFRKNQYDSQRDPGEQSLSTWWLRSQSSFHTGEGIKFYDPFSNPYSQTLGSNSYRYDSSLGVEVFDTQGQVTLLRRAQKTQDTTTASKIESVSVSNNDRILVTDSTSVKITDGTTSAMTTLSAGVSSAVYASCNDGQNLYYIDAANIVKVPLAGGSTSSVRSVSGITTAQIAYVKQRLVVGINNALYEFATGSAGPYTVTYTVLDATKNTATFTTSINHALRVGDRITVASIATGGATYNGTYVITAVTPNTISVLNTGANNALQSQSAGTITLNAAQPIYTHPNSSWVWTSITEGGSAIYASGFSGANSAVYKFTLDNSGAMPTLTSGVIAVVVPDGEIIHEIYVHLMSYIMLGTNKGVRAGTIDATGNITYGPLIIKTERPVRGFAAHNSYVYACSSFSNLAGENVPGLYIIDLASEIDNLRFAYATHVYAESLFQGEAVSACYLGRGDQLAFIAGTPSNAVTTIGDLGLYVQSATELYPSGYIQTGYIRYNTLEQKNFKRIVARGDYSVGSMTIATRDTSNILSDVVSYDSAVGNPEVTITTPRGAQDALSLRFTLYRGSTTTGPTFKGYQLKAVPATPRSRIIKVPLLCYDIDTDKYNSSVGYEGYSFEKLFALEDLEATGDVVTWQDFRTGEVKQALIEEVLFTGLTPPDKKLTGFGGIITLTIRTV